METGRPIRWLRVQMWVACLDQSGDSGAGKEQTDFEISFGGKPLLLLLSPNLIQPSPIGMPSATSLTDGQPMKKKIH